MTRDPTINTSDENNNIFIRICIHSGANQSQWTTVKFKHIWTYSKRNQCVWNVQLLYFEVVFSKYLYIIKNGVDIRQNDIS